MGKCIMCDTQGLAIDEDKICVECHAYMREQKRIISGKPPLGLEPKKFWIEQRMKDILDAINRYVQADMEIPIKWIEEYNQLIKFMGREKGN